MNTTEVKLIGLAGGCVGVGGWVLLVSAGVLAYSDRAAYHEFLFSGLGCMVVNWVMVRAAWRMLR